MKLAPYNKKRNFNKTREPVGKLATKNNHLYVIQKHAASHLHYDLRLELNGVLLSWAVPKGPCLDPKVKRLAIHVEDHPVDYGHFEGIIPKGEYGGGTVMLWDEGTWTALDDDPVRALKKGHLKFSLEAKKLKGIWNLIKFKTDDDKSWFLIKSKDKYAKPMTSYDITTKKPNSVLSSSSLNQIKEHYEKVWMSKPKVTKKKIKKQVLEIKLALKKSVFPKKINPQLATLIDHPPQNKEWLHEIKCDGYRIVAFKNEKSVTLMSRNHNDWTNKFKRIATEIQKLPIKKIIFDGEIVLLDEKQRSNFQKLQNAIGHDEPFKYYIFDLLYYDHYNIKPLPLIERKEYLQKILSCYPSELLIYNEHIIGDGNKIFKKACQLGLEGIVAKKINHPYEEKRTKAWLKIKCIKRQEFVIAGYSQPKGARKYFGSLYLGYYDQKGVLQFCGNVGTGFTEQSLSKIFNLLQKSMTPKNPFPIRPKGVTSAIWVQPKLIAEIEFTEWTVEGRLRHPSFKGLREDKQTKKITKEVTAHLESKHAKRKKR